jgi:hypothetical protein
MQETTMVRERLELAEQMSRPRPAPTRVMPAMPSPTKPPAP